MVVIGRSSAPRNALTRVGLPALVPAVAAAATWQHLRYRRVRRIVVHDRQRVLHSRGTFHVVFFLSADPEGDTVADVRALRRATEGSSAAWIYAGKAVIAPLHSAQMGEKEWDAVVLLQYPSRAAYERHSQTAEMRAALGRFREVYAQGFQRSSLLSALMPQILLAVRVAQIVGRRPSHFPLTRTSSEPMPLQAEEIGRRLLEERELGARAIVIVNLIRRGTREQRRADRRYTTAMFGAMAEGGYGPLHIGQAVQVERDYEFDAVVLVYYPGVEFFVDLVHSDYFQGIYGDKQLGDSQAVITVPIPDEMLE